MIIVADTSGLFAAFDAAQPEHDAALAVMEHELLAISPMVLTELDRLVHRSVGLPAAMQVMAALTARISDGTYKLGELRPADHWQPDHAGRSEGVRPVRRGLPTEHQCRTTAGSS